MSAFRSLADLQKDFQERQSSILALLKTATEADIVPAALADQGTLEQRTSPITGILTKVFQGKGYGFIAPGDGSKDVFLHFRDLVNGSSRDLVIGTKLHFQLLIDENGNRKAKNATLTKPQEVESSLALESSDGQMYSRQILLSTFGALRKSGSLLKENAAVPCLLCMPGPKSWHHEKSLYEEDPNLNDEECVIRLEARLSHESGADANNAETFGDGAKGGWTFEEAVEANSKVLGCFFGSGDSSSTATGDSASEPEYALEDLGEL